MKSTLHPLVSLLEFYYDNHGPAKEKNVDLDNLNFHLQFGLVIKAPETWPLIPAMSSVVQKAVSGNKSVSIVYSSTNVYHTLYNEMKSSGVDVNGVTFFGWTELYVAMDRNRKDSRELQRFRNILQSSDLCIFYGAPTGVPEIVDQVRGFCEGCLIVIF